MSSPTDRPDKPDDHSAYAPKWVRDSNRERSDETPRIAEDEFPQQNEQAFPQRGPVSDQARARRPLDTTPVRDARLAPRSWRPRAESELPDDSEQPPLHMPRSLNPQFLRDPPPAPRALVRPAALGGLAIAAALGAAVALFVTGKFPSELKMLGLSADKTAVESRFAGDTIKTPERLSSPAVESRFAGDTIKTPEQPSLLAARPP